MQVKIKDSREEKRCLVKVGYYSIEVDKTWTTVKPEEGIILYKTHQDLLDFDIPELKALQNDFLKNELLKMNKDEVKVETKAEVKIESKPIKVEVKSDEQLWLSMSRDELEAHARKTYGVELDKRKSISNMIAQLKNELR